MARRTIGKYWIGVAFVGALSVTLAVGWWLGHRRQTAELNALKSQLEKVSQQDSAEELRVQNDALMRYIDESYTLLHQAGFHIQLDLEQDEEGHYRLRADTAELTDELEAKLRELNQQPHQAKPNAP